MTVENFLNILFIQSTSKIFFVKQMYTYIRLVFYLKYAVGHIIFARKKQFLSCHGGTSCSQKNIWVESFIAVFSASWYFLKLFFRISVYFCKINQSYLFLLLIWIKITTTSTLDFRVTFMLDWYLPSVLSTNSKQFLLFWLYMYRKSLHSFYFSYVYWLVLSIDRFSSIHTKI